MEERHGSSDYVSRGQTSSQAPGFLSDWRSGSNFFQKKRTGKQLAVVTPCPPLWGHLGACGTQAWESSVGVRSLKWVILEIKISMHKTCLSGLLGAGIPAVSQIRQDTASDCPIAGRARSRWQPRSRLLCLSNTPARPSGAGESGSVPHRANFTAETKPSCLGGVAPQPIPNHGPPVQQTPDPKVTGARWPETIMMPWVFFSRLGQRPPQTEDEVMVAWRDAAKGTPRPAGPGAGTRLGGRLSRGRGGAQPPRGPAAALRSRGGSGGC